MASKRKFKKQLNNIAFDVIEECFSVQLHNPKKVEVTNKLIEEVVDFRDLILTKVHKAKSKEDFPVLYKEVEKASDDFIQKMNELQ